MRRSRPFLLVALAITVLLTTACGSGSGSGRGASPSTPGRSTADEALDRALARFVGDGAPPGIVVVVQRGSRPVLHAAGTIALDVAAPITLDDHLRIASVSKAYSGAVALAVVRGGSLGLDDTIGDRLPTLPSAWRAVTLRQLLQHTSGVPDFSRSPAFGDAVRASLTEAPPPEELLSFVADEPLEFTPGTRYEYSNSDNEIVALMVQAATGSSYEDALSQLVLEPLGLGATSLPSGVDIPAPAVHGYDLDATPPEDVTTLLAAGWSWASGGIVSTPADSNRFARAYARGELTDVATRRAQRRFRVGGSEPPGPGSNAAGLAIFRYRTRCGTVYGHTGNTLGYTHFLAASADGRRSVVVGVNAQVSPSTNASRFPALRRIFTLGVCSALS